MLSAIDHADGFTTLYGHFSRLLVTTGQKVSQGQLIGYGGSTGVASGKHLHFELAKNGALVDPLLYLAKGGAAASECESGVGGRAGESPRHRSCHRRADRRVPPGER